MTIIDRLREMPGKRREATKGVWEAHHYKSGISPSSVQATGQPISQLSMVANAMPMDATYIAACGCFSPEDWQAIVEVVEAARAARVYLDNDLFIFCGGTDWHERLADALAKLEVK